MDQTKDKNDCFKVPKIKPKAFLEKITLDSTQYMSDIWPSLVGNFIKPHISEKQMKVTSVWLINNHEAETKHIQRRQLMRKFMPKLSYSIGFIYINEFEKLRQIAKSGKINNGNLKNSYIAKASMGVSLCQFSDIYHAGYTNTGVPEKGYLVLVKYLKGRINYVPCDSKPMEPQPQFDCHLVKNPVIDTNTNCPKVFHQTQVFIYDYNEDGEIIDGHSKILPFAAVEFKWIGPYLYKMVNTHVTRKPRITEEPPVVVSPPIIPSANLENEKHELTFAVHQKNASSKIPFMMTIRGLTNAKLKATAYLYLATSINSLLKSDNDWNMSAVIEVHEFEKEFKRLQVNLNNARCPTSSKDLLDPLSQDIIISLNRPNLLASFEVDCESLNLNELSNLPQYVTYTRIVLDDYRHSVRLAELFKLSKTIGLISRPYDPEISILIFPDGSLSKNLGIPSIIDVSYFHGLVFHCQNPLFIILNNSLERKKEKDLYFSCLSTLKKQSIQSKFNNIQSPLSIDVLRQTVKSQSEVQRSFLFKIVKPQKNSDIISYSSICFDNDCEDFNCTYHNPVKKIRLDELPDKENIGSSNEESLVLQTNLGKGNERLCLSEKLFDYFKNSSEGNSELNSTKDNVVEGTDDQTVGKCEILPKSNEPSCSPNKGEIKSNIPPSIEIHIDFKPKKVKMNHVQDNYPEHGSFIPFQFISYNKVEYTTADGYKTKNLRCPISNGFHDVNKKLSESLWSFNPNQFKQFGNWRGASIYE